MRYIIEVKNKTAVQSLGEFLQKQGAKNVDIITSYEPVERLTKEVEQVGAALREYKQSGVSWSVMEKYLRGNGHSQKVIDSLLKDIKTFYRQMGILD